MDRVESLVDPATRPWMPIARDSQRGFYRLFRARPRPIEPPRPAAAPIRSNEKLHWTVIARYRQDLGYRPRNLAEYVSRHPEVLQGDPKTNPNLAAP
jgi:hypothetical protein